MIRILDKKRKLDKDTRFDALDGHHFAFNCKWEGQTVVKHPPRFVASALKRAFAHEPFWRALVVDGDRVAVTCSTPAGLEQVKTKFAELWAVVQRPPHTKLFITNIGNLHTVHVKAALSLYGKVTFFTRFGSAQGDVDTFFGDSASVGLLPRPDIDGIESSIEYEVVGAGVFTFNVARAETKDERLARLSRAKEVKAAEKVEHDVKDDPPPQDPNAWSKVVGRSSQHGHGGAGRGSQHGHGSVQAGRGIQHGHGRAQTGHEAPAQHMPALPKTDALPLGADSQASSVGQAHDQNPRDHAASDTKHQDGSRTLATCLKCTAGMPGDRCMICPTTPESSPHFSDAPPFVAPVQVHTQPQAQGTKRNHERVEATSQSTSSSSSAPKAPRHPDSSERGRSKSLTRGGDPRHGSTARSVSPRNPATRMRGTSRGQHVQKVAANAGTASQ